MNLLCFLVTIIKLHILIIKKIQNLKNNGTNNNNEKNV
jgi:hypothetical protein